MNKYLTGTAGLDQILGGGLVPGSVTLLAGDPGIGKSTLLLQLGLHLATLQNVLYISGEETPSQIKLRADRYFPEPSQIDLLAENSADTVARFLMGQAQYKIVIIDSIQTMTLGQLAAGAGTVSQITACANAFIAAAKSSDVAIIMVGHVTKEGTIAGPKILEHLVDTVLYLEGSRFGSFKILRGIKNRFGPTHEISLFEMTSRGLTSVVNPSKTLLAERQHQPGSVVFATIEGSRSFLVEVQALVSSSNFGYPKRTVAGIELNRLNLLIAVLSKISGFNLNSQDVYVNIVGGLKIVEPACDLAIILAIASALKQKAVASDLVAFGEVGLNGEVRTVNHIERRLHRKPKNGLLADPAQL